MSSSLIVVHPRFDAKWPFAADDVVDLWRGIVGPVEFHRLSLGDERALGEVVGPAPHVRSLMSLEVPITQSCLERFPNLAVAWLNSKGTVTPEVASMLATRRVRLIRHLDQAYWAESVAELALGLTIAQLRRIVGLDNAVRRQDTSVWSHAAAPLGAEPGQRGEQFCDDPEFVNGTVSGKRVRVLGAGSIASRYASYVRALGADVAAYDPFAPTSAFTLAGSRRVHSIEELVEDADIFAPMVPRTADTEGMVTARHVDLLPRGSLVVLATRARICDMEAIRGRVGRGELALAADVFDSEPLLPDDVLLTCDNTLLTPHVAGRTRDANRAWARMAVEMVVAAIRSEDEHG